MKLISIPTMAAFAVVAGAFAQTTKPAPKRKPEIQEVKATGCTVQAAETGCLLLKTLDGKLLTTSSPRIPRPPPG